MIQLDHVTYSYPILPGGAAGEQKPALRDLSLRVDEGEFLLVIGPSGSGKSTLLRCFNGLVPHFYGGTFQGRVEVAGRDPVAVGPRGMSDLVGFVFQDPEAQFVVDTVEDELAFAMENLALPQALMRKRVEEVLDQLGIAALRSRRVSTLSGGEKQRVAIASVLTLQPRVLVLDEPTSQLDPQAAEEVLVVLRQLNQDLGLTVVLSEHRLERVVQYADRILALSSPGEPVQLDTPGAVLARIGQTPPLITLGKKLGWQPLPLTIKDGRPFAREVVRQHENGRTGVTIHAPTPSNPSPSGIPIISVKDLWHRYNGHEALRGVNLEVRCGEFVALMGRNGSGKTTLLKHLVGLLRPGHGEVKVAELDTRQATVEEVARRVGYVSQDPGSLLFAETLREELEFTLKSHGLDGQKDNPTEALLRRLGLAEYAGRDPRDLSGGERQRAALAAILVADPEVILLDEPTRGLDYGQKETLAALLKAEQARGRAIIMATHDVELAASCAGRVVMLAEGQVVVDGPTRETMTESLVFSSQINKLFRNPCFVTVDDVLAYVNH
jgi:energy-coupling factor transport system ATP-binding protein